LFGLWWWALFTSNTAIPHRDAFFSRARDVGANATECCLDDAWFNAPEYGYTGFVPWERANGTPAAGGSGPFDLTRVSEAFWDNFLAGVECAISYGQTVQVKVQPTYYSWAEHTIGALWVPDRDQHPRRFNVQGEVLGDPDSDTGGHFFIASDADQYGNELINEACRRLKPYVDAKRLYFCTALEMAEKRLHTDTKRRLLANLPEAVVICNRQEWTPGMWRNMVTKAGLHGNEEHAKDDLQAFLNEFIADNKPPTRREMLAESTPLTVFLSSDGCRIDADPNSTYDYDRLEDVAVYILRDEGGNWSQQSVSKMPPFAWGRVDFGPMDGNELPMMRRIYERWKA